MDSTKAGVSVDILSKVSQELADKILRFSIDAFKPAPFLASWCMVSKAWKSRIQVSKVWEFVGDKAGFMVAAAEDGNNSEHVMATIKKRALRLKNLQDKISKEKAPEILTQYDMMCCDNGIVAAGKRVNVKEIHLIEPHTGKIIRKLPTGIPSNHHLQSLQMKEDFLMIYSQDGDSQDAPKEKAQRFALFDLSDGNLKFETWGNISQKQYFNTDFSRVHDLVAVKNYQPCSMSGYSYIRIYKISTGKRLLSTATESEDEYEEDEFEDEDDEDHCVPRVSGIRFQFVFPPDGDSHIFFLIWVQYPKIMVRKISLKETPIVIGETVVEVDNSSRSKEVSYDVAAANGIIHIFELYNYDDGNGPFSIVKKRSTLSYTGLESTDEDEVRGISNDVIQGRMQYLDFSSSSSCLIDPIPRSFGTYCKRLRGAYYHNIQILGVGKRFLLFRHFGQSKEAALLSNGEFWSDAAHKSVKDTYRVIRLHDLEEVDAYFTRSEWRRTKLGSLKLPFNKEVPLAYLLDKSWLDGIDGTTDQGPMLLRRYRATEKVELYHWT